MVYIRTKLHVPVTKGLVLITIKSKTKQDFVPAVLLYFSFINK
jgi:hypothetical protein